MTSSNPQPTPPLSAHATAARNLAVGIVMTIFAGVLLANMDAISKHLAPDLPLLQIVWGRYFFHALIVAALLLPKHGIAVLKARRPVVQMVRASCLLGVTFMLYWALGHVPLADATAVQFFAPVLVTILSAIFLKEAVGPRRFMAVLAGFIGVLLIVRPGLNMDWHMLLPFLSALLLAVYLLLTRVLNSTDDSRSTLFYTTSVGAVVLTLFLPLIWQSTDVWGMAQLVAMGALGAGGHFLIIKAMAFAPASTLSPFLYSHILTATLISVA
jgi:drug/metabolite transporter (DMT)-like permease